MKQLLTLSLLLIAQLVCAQSKDEKAVVDAERRRFDAQVSKDYAVLDKLLADDLIYAHSSGATDTKQSYIQSIRDGKSNYGSVDVLEQKVRVYGNTAVVKGVCQIKNTPPAADLKLSYTDVYVKKAGQWQMVTWQSLKIP